MAHKKPNIPALSSKVDSEVRKGFGALANWFNEVTEAGGLVTAKSLPSDMLSGSPVLAGLFDGSIPPQLQNLTATGAFAAIMLEWDLPRYKNISYVEVHRSTSNDLGTAQLIGTTVSSLYSDTPPHASMSASYYYWVRCISTSAVIGPFNATEGTEGHTANDPSYTLEILSGLITDSQLHKDLNARIDVSSALATAATALDNGTGETALRNILTQAGTIHKAINEEKIRSAAIVSEATARTTALADEALARTTELSAAASIWSAANAMEAATRSAALAVLDGVIGEAGLMHSLTQVTAIQKGITEEIGRGTAIAQEAADRARSILDEQEARGVAIGAEGAERSVLASKLLGADGTGLNSGLIYNERITTSSAQQSLSQQISLLTAGVEGGFDPYQTYYFDTTTEGWTGTGCIIAQNGGWVDQSSVSAAPATIEKVGLSLQGSKYATVKLRIKRLSGSGWGFSVDYQTNGAWNTGKSITSMALVVGDTTTLTVDFSDVTAWTGSTITGIRIKSGVTTDDRFSFDWVATGRHAPAVSVAAFQSEQQARADAHANEVTSRESLSSKLVGQADPDGLTISTMTSGLIFDEKYARSQADSSQVGRIETLESTVNDIDSGVAATANALDSVKLTVNNSETGVSALGARMQSLESYVSGPDGGALALISAEEKTRADLEKSLTEETRTTMSTFSSSGEGLLSQIVAGEGNRDLTAAFIRAEQNSRATALEAEATKRDTLSARVDSAEGAIVTEQHARADALNAEAGLRTALAAQLLGSDGTATSAGTIYEEQKIRIESEQALASRIFDMSVEIADNRAANIRDNKQAEANLEGSFTDETHSAASIFGPTGEVLLTNIVAGASGLKSSIALIATEQRTRVSALEAESTRTDSLVATVIDANDKKITALIDTEQKARATALEAEAEERKVLSARIGTAESAIISEQRSRATDINAEAIKSEALKVRVGDAESFLVQVDTVSATSDSAIAKRVFGMDVTIGDHTAEIGYINDIDINNGDSVSARTLATVKAAIDDPITGAFALITNEATTRATLEGALTDELHSTASLFGPTGETLLANIVAGKAMKDITSAFIREEQHTRATSTEAVTTKLLEMDTRFGDSQTELKDYYYTKSDIDGAQTEWLKTTLSQSNDNTASALTKYYTKSDIDSARTGWMNDALAASKGATAIALESYDTTTAPDTARAAARSLISASLNATFRQTTAPVTRGFKTDGTTNDPLQDGDTWIDSTDNKNSLYIYDGSTPYALTGWIAAADAAIAKNGVAIAVEQEVRAATIAPIFSESVSYDANKCVIHGTPPLLYRNKTGSFLMPGTWNSSQWTETPSDLYGQYSVKIDVNGKVSGFGLDNDGIISKMIVSVDDFAVARPVQFIGDTNPMSQIEGDEWAKTNGEVWKYISGMWVKQSGHSVPFSALTSPLVINGVIIPAGVSIDGASIRTATIGNAQVADLSADKLTVPGTTTIWEAIINIGKITNAFIGDTIQSTNYTPNENGWLIDKAGNCHFNGGTFSGKVVFGTGSSGYANMSDKPALGDLATSTLTESAVTTFAGLTDSKPAVDADKTSENISADTAKVNGADAATVTTNASNGATAYTGTTDYRGTAAPTNSPTITSTSFATSADGNVTMTVNYTYTQGTVTADSLLIYVKEGNSAITTSDPAYSTNPVSGYLTFTVKPSSPYHVNSQAIKTVASGASATAMSFDTSVSVPVGNYTGKVDGVSAATVQGNASSAVTATNNWVKPGQTTIDGNKIYTGDAYIDTLQIKGNAVTLPVGAYSAGTVGVGVIQTVTIASHGQPIFVNASAINVTGNNYYTIAFTIKRDGVAIYSSGNLLDGAFNANMADTFSFHLTDTPSSGSHTYTLEASGDCSFRCRSLFVMEILR